MTLVPEDRSFGLAALGFWYNGTLKLYTWDEAIAYYDQVDASFISQLGHDTKTLDQSKVRRGLAALASSQGSNYPTRSDFYDYLAQYGAVVTTGEVAEAAAAGVTEFGSDLFNVSKYLLPVAVIALLVVYQKPILAAFGELRKAAHA